MPTILITAFEPYDVWTENSSWLALMEFTRNMTSGARIVTRRYPVNLRQLRERLQEDLAENYDYALLLGQAPGATAIRLESIALNVGGSSKQSADTFQPLVADGPVAYRSALPLSVWARQLREAGIPATVSFHAGTYLCNAALYLTHHLAEQFQLRTAATFLHLPLDTTQVLGNSEEVAVLPTALCVAALRKIVELLIRPEPPDAAVLA